MCLDLVGCITVDKNKISKHLMAKNRKLVKKIMIHPYDGIHNAAIRIHALEEYGHWKCFRMLLSNKSKITEQDMIF